MSYAKLECTYVLATLVATGLASACSKPLTAPSTTTAPTFASMDGTGQLHPSSVSSASVVFDPTQTGDRDERGWGRP